MSETIDGKISVECACGKRLKAPASAVGKKAKCPGCGNSLTITAPPPAKEDSLADIFALADDAEKASKRQEKGPRCPTCSNPIDPDTVLCVNCGFNLKTGKQAAMAAVEVPPPPPKPGKVTLAGKKKPVDKLAPQRSFGFGLLGCFAGAFAGSLLWFLVAYFTGYELYFLAWVVGICCGIGMQIGQQGYSTMGGLVAAGMTFISVLGAKIAVVAAVLLPIAAGTSNEAFGVDLRLIDSMTDAELRAKGIDPEEATESQSEAASKAAERKIKAMSQAERDAKAASIEQEETKQSLVAMMTDEVLKEQKIENASEEQSTAAEAEAKKRVDDMPPEKQKTELARLEKEFAEKFAASLAKHRDAAAANDTGSGDHELSTSAKGGLVALFFVFFFGIKSLIFTVLAMFSAYRTASGAIGG